MFSASVKVTGESISFLTYTLHFTNVIDGYKFSFCDRLLTVQLKSELNHKNCLRLRLSFRWLYHFLHTSCRRSKCVYKRKCKCVYNGAWTCSGFIVGCRDRNNHYCQNHDHSIETCLQGSGDCSGY